MHVLIVQIVLFPWWALQYLKWYINWIWRFTINKEPLGDEQKLYLIRKNLKLSETQFQVEYNEGTMTHPRLIPRFIRYNKTLYHSCYTGAT